MSVVIPVYNTVRYLERCVDSLLDQDMRAEELEVIVVDDGSTDGSGEMLDGYASRDERITVIHQANSGWPGQPRNLGTAASRGRYVFFMDSDDYVGREAMRRMCDFADEHSSDVVIPRIVPFRARTWIWEQTLVDADLRVAFYTLSPQKLIRRSFIEAQGLQFSEGEVRQEDAIYLAEAYLCASRVSILGGYDFYHKCRRDDGSHITRRWAEPQARLSSVSTILDIIREFAKDDDLADDLALLFWEWKGLRLRPQRLLKLDPAGREEWVAAIGAVAESHIPRDLEARLTPVDQLRSEFFRNRDVDSLVALAEDPSRDDTWAFRDPRSRPDLRRDGMSNIAKDAEIDAIRKSLEGRVPRSQWESRLRTSAVLNGRRWRRRLAESMWSRSHRARERNQVRHIAEKRPPGGRAHQ